jgi:hypothetical protein
MSTRGTSSFLEEINKSINKSIKMEIKNNNKLM